VVPSRSTLVQLWDDPAGHTLSALTALLTEASSLFPDSIFHLGGDESISAAGYTGPCEVGTFRRLLIKLQQVLGKLGKTPMGWNDLITRTASAQPGTIIDAWTGSDDNFTTANATQLGHKVVDSDNGVFYLMYQVGRRSTVVAHHLISSYAVQHVHTFMLTRCI
jgi:hypothetical protein